ncbi:putative Ig domain-containing protein [Actinospica sp. MGRD01-02]|uniref:Ig domain-containing protein n=1 Tax=Actinospica acidithermotolerans TaxID=2828514 RepID=A0A941IIZ3_9ACTN|nr:Ig domain-containing protein [Actinospica acidithermotolerans]MBR7828869.1 putative Ig domain-containing protein [Actinospica acidithermotolerans]
MTSASSPAAKSQENNIPRSFSRRHILLGTAAATVAGLTWRAAPARAATASASGYAAPTLTRSTSSAGFVHPGLSVSADSLENARTQVLAGVEPWASYYAAMTSTKYASQTFSSQNQGSTLDTPKYSAFNSSGVQSEFIDDAFRAYTQAIMYFVTGNPVYRENAMKLIRIWSNMDPNGYVVYADAHIHTGVPLMRMLAAAEIMRYSSVNAGTDSYDLTWEDADTTKLSDNLVVPLTNTFLYSNTFFMNQHNYALVGALAGYIFTDNATRYQEAVEWFSVNSTNTDDATNGALIKIMPLIAKNDPLNTFKKSFVQVNEMWRDQAHAWDDVSQLSQLARLIDVQGTLLDPVKGTVSTASNAVSPYRFGDDRLLHGSEQFFSYMLGKEIPWIDVTGHGGVPVQAFRGRIFDPTNELYDVYKYRFGLGVEGLAPSITQVATTQDDGPQFYWGTTAYNFWNSNPDWTPDAWLSFPAALAGTTPPTQSSALIQAATRSAAITGGISIGQDSGTSYVRMTACPKGVTLAIRTLLYPSQSGYSPVGVLLRTNGTATLQIRKTMSSQPYYSLTLPDTQGAWRYITYDVDNTKIRGGLGNIDIAYYTVVGSGGVYVDIEAVNLDAVNELTPPQFPAGSDTTLIAIVGESLSADLAATYSGSGTVTYSAGLGLPQGVTLDASTGALTWTPTASQVGTSHTYVVASDGTTDTVLRVALVAAANRTDAVNAALAGYDPSTVYVSATATAVKTKQAAATADIASADSATFAADLVALQEAVAGLQLLNPRLADGSFDYWGLATSAQWSQVDMAALTDGDNNTNAGGSVTTPDVFDFGIGFRVQADAFGLQAYYDFANRSQGANVYGAEDGRNWTLLTSRETTDTTDEGFAMEKIPVLSSVQGKAYRFLKIQVDNPGTATDPNYPGITSFGEFHIYGQRVEMSTAMNSVSVSSNDSNSAMAENGDTVTLTMSATEALQSVTATIEGVTAQVTSTDSEHWTASVVLPADVAYGRALQFEIDYTTAAGATGGTIIATTDGSSLQLWNTNATQLTIEESWVTASTPQYPGTGTAAANGWRMFDGDTTTFTDTTTANGWVTVTPPSGTDLTFDVVRIRPRANLPLRGNGDLIQGSSDGGSTWTTLVTISGITVGTQWYAFALGSSTTQPMIRVYDGHGGHTNLAEVQLYSLG